MSAGGRALALAAPLLCSLACGTARLAPELEQLEGLRAFTGRAMAPAPGAAVLVAVLAPGPAGERVVHYDLASARGEFLFVVPPGRYRLAAFADRDGDFRRGADEPAALGAIEVRAAGPDAAPQQVGELVLAAGAPTPALDLAAWGPEAGPDRARRVGEVVVLDDPRFAAETVSAGLWEPLGFAAESGMRLFFLAPHDATRTPVVFVHGMLGSPRDFAPLVAALDRERFEPWLFYYPSGLSLDLSALFLAEALEEASRRLGVDRVHLVAHSMGGLVSRAALDFRLRRGRAPLVAEFVTLSTPWGGARGARGMKLGVALAPAVAPSWRDMLPASDFLARIAERPLPPGVRHTLLFGYAGGSVRISGADDDSAALTSMLLWDVARQAQFVLGFPADHEAILADSRVVEVLRRLLRGQPPTPGTERR